MLLDTSFLPFPLILQESGTALYEEVTKGAVSRETLLCSECHSHKEGDVGATKGLLTS